MWIIYLNKACKYIICLGRMLHFSTRNIWYHLSIPLEVCFRRFGYLCVIVPCVHLKPYQKDLKHVWRYTLCRSANATNIEFACVIHGNKWGLTVFGGDFLVFYFRHYCKTRGRNTARLSTSNDDAKTCTKERLKQLCKRKLYTYSYSS